MTGQLIERGKGGLLLFRGGGCQGLQVAPVAQFVACSQVASQMVDDGACCDVITFH